MTGIAILLIFAGLLICFMGIGLAFEKKDREDQRDQMQGRIHELEQVVNNLSLQLQRERNKPPRIVYSRPSTRASKKKGRRHPHPKYANRARKKGATRYYDE